jgi:DNA ligase-1
MPTKTIRRKFLQLANTYKPDKHSIAGFYISEKLDGGRCFWDGGLSRGVHISHVPWAGVLDPKTGNPKGKLKTTCTGLWSRYGNPIMAPDWFLNALPCCPLDGELWLGRGKFQKTMSAIRKDRPIDTEWADIKFAVYSSPPLPLLFADGEIKDPQMLCSISREACEQFVLSRLDTFGNDYKSVSPEGTFEQEVTFLQAYLDTQSDRCFMHRQVRLPREEEAARSAADNFVTGVLEKGGEGAMLRDGSAVWTPKRHNGLLKFKPFDDDECRLIGFFAGEEGKQGNCLGKIGALAVQYGDVEFKIGGGLTYAEREFAAEGDTEYATTHPGERMPASTQGKHFKVGQQLTFKFRELSNDGVPKEARFWRVREDE